MELIYFFIGLGVLGLGAYIWARWFYHENDNDAAKDTVLRAEK